MRSFPLNSLRVPIFVAIAASTAFAAAPQSNAPASRTQAVVQRIQQITELRLPEWRVHDDTVLHPEDPRTSDADWSTAKVGEEWNTGPRWFRCWVEIPPTLFNYDIRNATVRLRTRIDGENPIFVRIFVDGKLVPRGHIRIGQAKRWHCDL